MGDPPMVPVVVLTFGEQRVEVRAVTGPEQLQQAAEAAFRLQPETYQLFDGCGKVDGPALTRALRMMAAGHLEATLEVRERPEWKKLRELEARVEAVAAAAQGAAVDGGGAGDLLQQAELQGIEERVMAKVAAALGGFEQELQRARAKVDVALAPVIKTLALAQIDMKAQLEALDLKVLESRLAGLEERVAAAWPRPTSKDAYFHLPACKLDVDPELSRKPGRTPSCCTVAGQGQEEADLRGAEAGGGGGRSPGITRRCELLSVKQQVRNFADASGPEPLPGIAGAKVWQRGAKMGDLEWAEAAPTPFARGGPAARTVERKAGSRSLPYLPSVY